MTILAAGHDIKCMFTTPKLLDALALRAGEGGHEHPQDRHHRHLLRRHRDDAAVDPLRHRGVARHGVYMTPTYGNTLMGLACSEAGRPRQTTTRSPTTRRSRGPSIEVVDFDDHDKVVDYGQTGRVKLTTLTKEFFVPGFLERDEGEREQPYDEVSLGRRQRRAAVPRVGRSDDGGSVLIALRSPIDAIP